MKKERVEPRHEMPMGYPVIGALVDKCSREEQKTIFNTNKISYCEVTV